MSDQENDDYLDDDMQEQIEQMIIDNSVTLQALTALLVRKGILSQEEIDEELTKLYDELSVEE